MIHKDIVRNAPIGQTIIVLEEFDPPSYAYWDEDLKEYFIDGEYPVNDYNYCIWGFEPEENASAEDIVRKLIINSGRFPFSPKLDDINNVTFTTTSYGQNLSFKLFGHSPKTNEEWTKLLQNAKQDVLRPQNDNLTIISMI